MLSTAFIQQGTWATKDTTEIFLSEFKQLDVNRGKTEKTIRNFITETASLFSLLETSQGESRAGRNAIMLAENQHLPDFFLRFLSRFQFPGGHVKDRYNADLVQNKIEFKPAKFLVELILSGHKHEMNRSRRAFGISAMEATWFALNDLLALQGKRKPEENALRLIKYREQGLEPELPDLEIYKLPKGIATAPGDFVRYSRDCLNWLSHARVLIQSDGRWYLRSGSTDRINYLLDDDSFFDHYSNVPLENFPQIKDSWLSFANDFSSSPVPKLAESFEERSLIEIPRVRETSLDLVIDEISLHSGENLSNAEIGKRGEIIVKQHEMVKLKRAGLEDLAKKVHKVLDHEGVGYDIASYDLQGSPIQIEVKSTMGTNPSRINRFKLTTNEWVKAEELGASYFVYRVLLADEDGIKLYSLTNPVKLYKSDAISMKPKDGAYVAFENINEIGKEIELLY